MNKNKPWFPFYWKDWSLDQKLKLCSWEAKGMLADLMAMMWVTGGKLTDLQGMSEEDLHESIGLLLGTKPSLVRKTLQELIKFDRIQVGSDGVLECKKLIEIHEIQEEMSKRGKLGGNPQLKQVVKPKAKAKVKDKLQPSATPLARLLIQEIEKSTGRKLITSPQGSATYIAKLLKAGIEEKDIEAAIKWLVTDNLKSGFPFQVQSGKSLFEKWDRIQSSMQNSGSTGDTKEDASKIKMREIRAEKDKRNSRQNRGDN